jgi:uncharacterized protein YyaL (SSP411 family)
MPRRLIFIAFLVLLSRPVGAAIRWEKWDDALFARAKREQRFVLLDLEAVWCHWCHVMDTTTYRDPAVTALIDGKYIAVKVDQDSRPDLSNRYGEWGWPATIIFNADGGEIVRRRGYIEPAEMRSLLQAVIDDPSPGPSVFAEPEPVLPDVPRLSDSQRAEVVKRNDELYDAKHGGWGFSHKYLDADSVEWAMTRASRGDQHAGEMARQTLAAAQAIIDPAWGGIYQYSVDGDWKEPHFEKIMSMQAGALRAYSLGYARWRDPAYLHAAQSIRRYVTTFLRGPGGAFFTSQDADLVEGEHSAAYFALSDGQRRARGIPRVDRNSYARENGWMIEALCAYADATGDDSAIAEAVRAAEWVNAHLGNGEGGFKHGSAAAGPYLGDTLAMGKGQLALYVSTGDRRWLERAQACARFIDQRFAHGVTTAPPAGSGHPAVADGAGFVTSAGAGKLAAAIDHDENVAVARFANLLARYSGNPQWTKMNQRAMRWLAAPEVARLQPAGGVLLADDESTHEPLHVTIVGSKSDPHAAELFRAARAVPVSYRRIEWLDAREGELPNNDVTFPKLSRAAAFSCSGRACSLPAFDVAELRRRLNGGSVP